jgi:prevent-host-death family protein
MPSVAEARNNLSELIDHALRGEGVVITRHGRPVVELRPVRPAARAVTEADLDWLASRRVASTRLRSDAGALVSRMRDDEER